MAKRKAHVTVTVKDDNIDRKLRQFKKKVEREGVVRDSKRLVYFESPSQKQRKKRMRAVKQEAMRRAMLRLP
jgi:small subunit ribosomal protein S21